MIHGAFPSWYTTVIVRRSWSHKYLERMTHLHLQNPCVCLSCSEIDGHSNPAFQRAVQRALHMTYTRGRGSLAWCIIGAAAILFLWSYEYFFIPGQKGVEGDDQGISFPHRVSQRPQNDFMSFVLSPRLTTWAEFCPKTTYCTVRKAEKLFAMEATEIQGKLDVNGYTYGVFALEFLMWTDVRYWYLRKV